MTEKLGSFSLQQKLIEQQGCYDAIEEWEQEQDTIPDVPQVMNVVVYGPPKYRKNYNNMSVNDILRDYMLDETLKEYLEDE